MPAMITSQNHPPVTKQLSLRDRLHDCEESLSAILGFMRVIEATMEQQSQNGGPHKYDEHVWHVHHHVQKEIERIRGHVDSALSEIHASTTGKISTKLQEEEQGPSYETLEHVRRAYSALYSNTYVASLVLREERSEATGHISDSLDNSIDELGNALKLAGVLN
jgi:hypothetical protein